MLEDLVTSSQRMAHLILLSWCLAAASMSAMGLLWDLPIAAHLVPDGSEGSVVISILLYPLLLRWKLTPLSFL